MVTIKETICHLNADFKRRVLFEGKPFNCISVLSLLLKKGMVTVILYRFNRYFVFTKCRFLCKIIAWIDYSYTKSEVSPMAEIGSGLVLGDSGMHGITHVSRIGKNCTFLGFSTIGTGATSTADPENDRILIGDHCVFGLRARVMRPVSIADGAQIKSNAVVIVSSNKKGATLSGVPAKVRRVDELESILSWNPIKGEFLLGNRHV